MLLGMLMSKKTLYRHSERFDIKRNGIQGYDEVVSNALSSWVPEHANSVGDYLHNTGYPETWVIFVRVSWLMTLLGYHMITTAVDKIEVRCILYNLEMLWEK